LYNEKGKFIIVDPTVNMAGIAYKQQANGIAKAGSDSVIASIFTDEPRQGQQSNQAPQQQQVGQQGNQNSDFDQDVPW